MDHSTDHHEALSDSIKTNASDHPTTHTSAQQQQPPVNSAASASTSTVPAPTRPRRSRTRASAAVDPDPSVPAQPSSSIPASISPTESTGRRPRRSARFSTSTSPPEAESSNAQTAITDSAKGKKRLSVDDSINPSSKRSSNVPTTSDTKGKKRASFASILEPSSEDTSSSSSKKRKSLDGTPARVYSLRSRDEGEVTAEQSSATSAKAKGKGKAVDTKPKSAAKKKKMPKRPTNKAHKSSGSGNNESSKKGDRSARQLVDDSAEGDMSWFMSGESGPSNRGMDEHDHEDEDDHLGESHDEDDEEEHDENEDEEEDDNGEYRPGGLLGGPSGGANPFTRLAQLAGESGMHLDEATAAALFGGGFRQYGMSSGFSGRFKRLRSELQSSSTSLRLSALRECSEILLISNEDTLGTGFNINAFATEFIAILKGKPNIDPNAPTTSSVGQDAGQMNEDEELAAVLAMSAGEAMPNQTESEEEMECQLVACRCLAHLMEALPGTAHTLVHLGVVPVLSSKLAEISYIELAEQTLSTIEKISAEYPASIVREAGFTPLLEYLPFFSTNVQRTALTATANCCKNISSDAFVKIRNVFPTLRENLVQSDQRIVEQATLAMVRTIEAYRHNDNYLQGLLDMPTVVAINTLLMPSGGSPLLSPSTYTHVIRALTQAAKGSAKVTLILLEAGVTNTVYQILTGVLPPDHDEDEQGMSSGGQGLAGGVADMAVLQNLAHRPKDQVEETLALVCELLPPMPKDGVFDPRAYTEKALQRLKKSSRRTRQHGRPRDDADRPVDDAAPHAHADGAATPASTDAPTPTASEDGPGNLLDLAPIAAPPTVLGSSSKLKKDDENPSEKRLNLLQKNPELMSKFIKAIVPVLVDVYAASIAPRVRGKVLNGLLRAIPFADSRSLHSTLQSVPMASFLGAIISSKDHPSFLYGALQLVEVLTIKLPDVYQTSFMREGVVYEIEQLAKQDLANPRDVRKAAERAAAAAKVEPQDPPVAGPSNPSSSTFLPRRHDPISLMTEDVKPALTASMAAYLSAEGLISTSASTVRDKKIPTLADAQDAVIVRARFLGAKKVFDVGGDDKSEARAVLDDLGNLVHRLCKPDASENELYEALRETANHFTAADSALSSFELLKGGVIDGLLDFVDVDGTVPSSQRRSMLYEVFAENAPASSVSPMTILVKRLHESLGRLEAFEVETAFGGQVDQSRPGASQLSRTMRIKLSAEEGQDIPRHVGNLSVTIQAIAPLQALYDYLRPRVADANYGSGLSRMLAAYDGGAGGSGGAGGFGGLGNGRPGGSGSLLSALMAQRSASAGALTGLPAPAAPTPAQPTSAPALPSSAPDANRLPPPAPDALAPPTSGAQSRPQRRRSARLSAQHTGAEGVPSTEAGSSNNNAGPIATAPAVPPILSSSAPEPSSMIPALAMDMDLDDDYSDEEYGEEVFEEDVQEELDRSQEKVVNMSVAPDGSRVEAKTPDGTRVATPSNNAPTTGAASLAPPAGPSGTATPRTASYAGAVKAPATDWHLEFSLNGKKLRLQDTIYGVVHQQQAALPAGAMTGGPLASSIALTWKKVDGPVPTDVSTALDAPSPASVASAAVTGLDASAPTTKIIRLLRVVHNLTVEARAVSSRDDQMDENLFVNNKLTAKLTRQLEEVMILASGCLPDWAVELPKHFAFLFPFETRYSFLQNTAFGYGRLIAKHSSAQQQNNRNARGRDDLSHLARIARQKVRISRAQLLESCMKVMELYGTSGGILEVEYFDEIGTGLGPTLEFYSLASKAFARRNLGIWRDEDQTIPGDFVHHPKGLFPVPLPAHEPALGTPTSRLNFFKTLGIFVGRALLDSRIIDLNLNTVFLKLLLDQPVKRNIATLKRVDPQLARSLEGLQAYLLARKEIESLPLPPNARRNKLMTLTIGGARLSDLSLDFTVPGFGFDLVPGGAHIDVDDNNLEEYLSLVLDMTLGSGIAKQVKAFQDGFSTIIPINDLKIFSPEEVGLLIGNTEEDWSRETLEQAIKADHGYNLDSRAVSNLIDVMSSYTQDQRRAFLQFITGAPKLPIGGFKGLTPPFTVVRKPHDPPFKADDYLPSVMTCAQYLKMPDYSTREVLAAQLERAIHDGGGSFHLS